jgi:hypothetical protein
VHVATADASLLAFFLQTFASHYSQTSKNPLLFRGDELATIEPCTPAAEDWYATASQFHQIQHLHAANAQSAKMQFNGYDH